MSSNEEADGSDSGGAEADRDDDDDEDADEMAPSDAIIQNNEDQTGHNIGMGMKSIANTGELRERSPKNIADGKQRTFQRKALKPTRHVKGKNVESDDDEDDYSGVDLISDSEEEPTVEQLEEKVIIESEEEYNSNCKTPPILSSISSDGWTGFDLEGDLFLSDVPYFDEQIGRTDPSILAEEIEIFNSTSFSQGFYDVELPPRLTPPRRVRFAEDVRESDKSSAIASDMEHNHNQGYGSFGLDDGQEGAASANRDSEDEDADSSSGRSSGYESGYCVELCDRLCNANSICFQLILARRPRKKMSRHLQPHDRNHFSVVHPCHPSRGVLKQHQLQEGGCLHPIIAGAQPWVHGLPTPRNQWRLWIALAPDWSSTLLSVPKSRISFLPHSGAALLVAQTLALVPPCPNWPSQSTIARLSRAPGQVKIL